MFSESLTHLKMLRTIIVQSDERKGELIMKRYTVTTREQLRLLCIRKNWFTCGTNEQYEKLFYANESGCPIEELATIIWLCSDDCRRSDILEDLISEYDKYKQSLISSFPIDEYLKAENIIKSAVKYLGEDERYVEIIPTESSNIWIVSLWGDYFGIYDTTRKTFVD